MGSVTRRRVSDPQAPWWSTASWRTKWGARSSGGRLSRLVRRRLPGMLTVAGLFATTGSCVTSVPVPPVGAESGVPPLWTQAERYLHQKRYRLAGDRYRDAARVASLEGNRRTKAESLVAAGESYLTGGERTLSWLAFSDAKQTLSRLTPSDSVRVSGTIRVNSGLGDLDFLAGRLGNAVTHYREALASARGATRDSLHYRLSLVAEKQGDADAMSANRRQILRDDVVAFRRLRQTFLGSTQEAPKATPGWAVPLPGTPLAVRPRSTWAAEASRSNVTPMGRIHRITVHHTGDEFVAVSAADTASTLKRIQKHHIRNNGWADIGYHFLIDPQGRVWEGRSLAHQGAHAGSPDLNRGNVGIALLGNYKARHPGVSQTNALHQLMDALRRRYSMPLSQVFTHREIRPTPTDCPGPIIQGLVNDYRRAPALASR